MSRALLPVLALACASCAPLRFVDRGIVWDEHDAAPIARPAENPLVVDWSAVRDTVFQPLERALTLDYAVEAENVNALDEVPESSWFHDPRRDSPAARERPRALTPTEMAWGAATPDDVPVQPLIVVKAKLIGRTRGFIAKDARGVRYMVKLDPPGRPQFATSVEVVVSRLAWACGWRVPAEVMIDVPVGELSIAPASHLGQADLEALLADLPVDGAGHMRMLASRWLPGVNVGPFRYFGRRRDDGNDRFAHENRRELRGFAVFSAWVNNVDTLENNTLDMYEGPPGRGHLVHYQQDVGGAFDVWGFQPMLYWMGHETYFDMAHIVAALVGFGFSSGYWEGARFRDDYEARLARSPELAAFDGEHFEPRAWRPNLPNAAFARLTARDRYWAAKRIALIDEPELRAAIAAGHYRSDVAERLFAILWLRRDKILRAYLSDVTPLDHFRVDRAQLCFDDLWRRARLGGAASYAAREGGRRLPVTDRGDGVGCVTMPSTDGYHVVELAVSRGGARGRAPVRVHVRAAAGGLRLVGVER